MQGSGGAPEGRAPAEGANTSVEAADISLSVWRGCSHALKTLPKFCSWSLRSVVGMRFGSTGDKLALV